MIDSVYVKHKTYYPQVFLEEFKNYIKEKKMSKFFTGYREISSYDQDKKNSDEENSDEEN